MTVPDSSPAFPRIWGNVPQRNMNFTGRKEILTQLREGVSSAVTAVLPHALQGMGGVGKTAVAIEYAHLFRSEYELVWWIPADRPALVRSSLAALAGPLGLESATAGGIETAATAVLNALRLGEPVRRWLLVFDNADQPEEINEIIPRGPGHVLITSRNHRWQSVVDTVSVDVFTRGESTAFLAKRVRGGISESEAGRLAEELGDLPLALEQAGALQAETGMSVDEYLRLLRQHAPAIMDEGRSPEYPRSMTAAWRLSVSTLEQQMPLALELLRCCAFFGPEPIPRDVFRLGTQAGENPVGDPLENPILLARAIRELGRFALVRIDGRTIQVHRLIQALLRDELPLDRQDRYRHEVHLILAASAPKDPDDNDLWPRFSDLVAHVAAPATDMASCRSPDVRFFVLNVIRYLYRSGDRKSSRDFAERFISRWTKDSGAEDPAVLGAYRHLGNSLRDLGLYNEAHSVIGPTLEGASRILGERDPLTLSLASSYAADLRARGDFRDAQKLDEVTVQLREETLGPTRTETLRAKNNLALDYGLTSDYKHAQELQESTFRLQNEGTEGVNQTDVLISWNGLARLVRLRGYYSEARDVGEEAYDYGLETLGRENYWTLRTGIDLSIALRRIGSTRGASLALAREIYDRCVRLFGQEHPDTLAAAISLINIQRTMGITDEALALAVLTMDRYPEIYGPDHPYNYGVIGNLALLRRVTGDSAEAHRLDKKALAGLDGRLTRDHHYSLTAATNLASDLAALGDVTAACELGGDTWGRLRRLLDDDHPLTIGCAANLAVDRRASGDEDGALALHDEAMQLYADTIGLDHPDAEAAAEWRRLDFDFDPPPI
ncbi:MAG TPA: FxSxx-COOH system tetratricopeptide repeat protein [Streptosporangiaceae bacterium]|nr:FxSxx-COOH system tetratricopeptide repeat protein [Streptosporangiaceae bacterium]